MKKVLDILKTCVKLEMTEIREPSFLVTKNLIRRRMLRMMKRNKGGLEEIKQRFLNSVPTGSGEVKSVRSRLRRDDIRRKSKRIASDEVFVGQKEELVRASESPTLQGRGSVKSNWDYQWWESIEEDWVSPYEDSSEAVRFTYWWEDMRPHEVKKLIKEAYEVGYDRGVTDSMDNFEKEREESIRNRLDKLKEEIYHLEMEIGNGF